jgi:DNA-binding transcriptional MocR family regulator
LYSLQLGNASMATADIVWRPHLPHGGGPVFKGIADAIEADLRSGRLSVGDPLPTQRQLADELGLNFTTITRAYAEAKRRGLLTARVGRGTFVASLSARSALAGERRDVDLSENTPPIPDWLDSALWSAMDRLRKNPSSTQRLLSYESRHRDAEMHHAGLSWLRARGLDPSPERVVSTAGGQHALSLLLQTLAKPGDIVLVESLSYPGVQSAAAAAAVQLVGVDLDDEGVRPDSLEQACRKHKPKALFCVPTLQNPTAAVMSLKRRQAIIEVARKHRIRVVEDDICGPLLASAPPPFAALAPEIAVYIGSLSKCVAPGLRVAFVLAPREEDATMLRSAVRASLLLLPPLMVALAQSWIADGTAERAIVDIRKESVARGAILHRLFSGFEITAPAGSLHAWLQLPRAWTLAAFVAQAQQHRIRVAPADWYVMPPSTDGRKLDVPAAVRLTVGAEPNREEFEGAIRTLASVLEHGPTRQSSRL